MQAVTNFIRQHDKIVAAFSFGALGAYLLARNSIWGMPKPHKLEVSLRKLIQNSKNDSIFRIVLMVAPSSQGQFKSLLASYLKGIFSEDDVKVLINCSPQKLLKAGCQCFLESMQEDDKDFAEYYLNALKTQYLIEDTIASIQLIDQNMNKPIIMICDNNVFDIKLMNPSNKLWTSFLDNNHIQQRQLIETYDMVFHIIEQDSNAKQGQRIREIWKDFPRYHEIKVASKNLRQHYKEVSDLIKGLLDKKSDNNQPDSAQS